MILLVEGACINSAATTRCSCSKPATCHGRSSACFVFRACGCESGKLKRRQAPTMWWPSSSRMFCSLPHILSHRALKVPGNGKPAGVGVRRRCVTAWQQRAQCRTPCHMVGSSSTSPVVDRPEIVSGEPKDRGRWSSSMSGSWRQWRTCGWGIPDSQLCRGRGSAIGSGRWGG